MYKAEQIMRRRIHLVTLGMLAAVSMIHLNAAQQEKRFFEMRTYYAAPGKLDDLLARFRDHTMTIFEKHGMANIGYWVPLTNTENKLVYILAYPDREAREASWKAFSSDPEWKKVASESEKNGKLVTKVESVYMKATDFSPTVSPQREAEPRVFELRVYHATPGKLEALLTRFREHTTKLFEKHGMTNFGYWVPIEARDGAGEKLIYILAHKSREAGEASFKAFRADPQWTKVKSESEANGSLTVTNGVQSLLMAPTDFSPTK
jgi:hypothetical protein